MKRTPACAPVTKIRMHLVARVPNEGARRLAWWIGTHCGGDLQIAAWRLLIDTGQLVRLLDGSMLPGSTLLADLVPRTDAAVRPLDWFHRPLGGWFDAPCDRSAPAHAA